MLFLPAAALCCLCSALVAIAAEPIKNDLTLTRRVGDKVSFSCQRIDQCGSYDVHWFQKRDTETFRRILHIDMKYCEIDSRFNQPHEDEFSAVFNRNDCELEIQNVKLSHSASYYCFCRGYLHRLYVPNAFGSGTKLYVTDEPVVKPVVTVYPAASRAHPEGKSSLLCLASAMFPPLVQFSWKRRKENGPLEELPPAVGEQLELRESGRTAAILLIHQRENSTYKYRCYVRHEGGTVEAQTEQEVPAPADSGLPEREPAHLPALEQADCKITCCLSFNHHVSFSTSVSVSFQSQCKVTLLCVLYTVLIVKSLVYCCGLFLLMILRNKGPSTNCTHAD
ncbi:immunoglobulin lambda-1 light chain-like [Sebastes fasciatus]|uniref:immunoglobulin lambda-1 light chain-like n=1 Tax=Sebastes fasciatus TaxID=394691 RepID=UPI003D9F6814